jgi:Tfp pilus assembly protein PilF
MVFLCLAVLSFPQTTEDNQNLAAHIQKAQEYLSEKRSDLAILELQAAVALDPANVETQGNLGMPLYFQGKPGEAIPHLRAVVKLRPGMAKIQTSDLERAGSIVARLEKMAPQNPKVLYAAYRTYLNLSRRHARLVAGRASVGSEASVGDP